MRIALMTIVKTMLLFSISCKAQTDKSEVQPTCDEINTLIAQNSPLNGAVICAPSCKYRHGFLVML